jgi:hypothetical protein
MAFVMCGGLASIEIPNSVTSIGEWAFAMCSGLEKVTNYATTPQNIESKEVFVGVTLTGCTLYVPEGSIGLYQAADGWKEFTNIQAIPDPDPTAIENTNLKSEIKNHKLIKDGMLLILRDGRTYNASGAVVK